MKYLWLGFLACAPLLWACSNDGSTGGNGGCGVGWGPSVGGGGQAPGSSTSNGSGPTTSGAGPSTSGASTGPAGTSGGPSTSGAGGAAQATSAAGTGGAGGAACGAGGIYDTPEVCTSNMTWTLGNDATMRPGEACQTCHVLLGQATGETFDVSGTVYPTAHEPNDCDGIAGIRVVITDATGASTTLTTNAAGNFYHDDLFGFAAFKTPLKAKVTSNAGTREMVSSVTTGDCNSCHTEAGTVSAPGRVMAP
jgi:hypothetical protein